MTDESFREPIITAQLLVKEKTELRDEIHDQIIEIRDVLRSHNAVYKAAKLEAIAARQLVGLKRQEIDSVMDEINRFKNAMSVEDADRRISNMEKIALKDEKQLKQLKALRDQLALSMGTPEEVRHAIEKKDQNEDRMKTLRKELESLKNKVSKAEVVVKKYNEDCRRERELHTQFRAADDICQNVYALFNILKTLSYDKEREKRMRKKENKAGDGSINGEEPASSESSSEITTKEIETLVKVNAKKKTQKPPVHFFSKQLKPTPILPPLINRNKKQRKLWGKVVLAVVAIIVLVYVLS